ncbi:MAG: polysaccharide biosynthesis protein, partial [Clostridia bacterium]|nr:polysaccharide biosynthesis protein [Clostridia bacterium]
MVKYTRIALLVVLDILITNFSYIFAFLLRFEFQIDDFFMSWLTSYTSNALQITLITVISFAVLGVYTTLWRYAGSEELTKIGFATLVSVLLVLAYMHFTGQYMPRSIYIISGIILMLLVSVSRMLYRHIRTLRNPGAFNSFVLSVGKHELIGSDVSKVMVVGAGEAGATIINEIRQHPEYGKKVVAAIDDNPEKQGKQILGVRILGGTADIEVVAEKKKVREIIIAIPSAGKKTIQAIVNECNKTNCKVKILPGLIDLINDKVSISRLRDVDIEDLLGRDPVHLDQSEISIYLKDRVVLVSGGGGSIGSELCRQIARFRPRRLIALDIYENTLFELANEMKGAFPDLEFEPVICSVRDEGRLEQVFAKYTPHVVFHAAAHKHVPLMELNPKEAIVNNIIGTKNMIDISEKYAVLKFVM